MFGFWLHSNYMAEVRETGGSACIGFMVLWMDGCIVLSVETIGHARNGLYVLYNLISHKLVANFFKNSFACLPVCFSYCTLLFAFVVEKGLEAK